MAKTVKIEGLKELGAALRELPKSTQRNTLRRVLKKRAEPVRDEWRSRVPRDSGEYERSVIVGTRLTKRQAREARKEGKSFAEVYVGTADPAGQQQEFGNVNHPAQPSGRPAWEAAQDEFLEGVAADLAAEIDKAAARFARKAARLARKG